LRPMRYERACIWLARTGIKLGLERRLARENERIGPSRTRLRDQRDAQKDLGTYSGLAGIELSPRTIAVAADAAWIIAAITVFVCAVLLHLIVGSQSVIPAVFAGVCGPFLIREVFRRYPRSVASRSAKAVLASSAESINLMIMSLRHEPSLSRAIRFASRREGAFAHELRRCEWNVLTGEFSSFEEALQNLGDRWSRFSGEIRSCVNSMVTSTCESTEDGRRRALDRANQAMVSGAKRRVEEYILSLSTPSMVIFGIGVLLPLMVGSFLPMMSWDFWSISDVEGDQMQEGGRDLIFTTVFLMNVLFPAVGLLTVLSAVSQNPVRSKTALREEGTHPRKIWFMVAGSASIGTCLLSGYSLDGFVKSAAILISCLVPLALTLVWTCQRQDPPADDSSTEDLLFRVGARMVEGQNFESAMRDSVKDSESSRILWTRLLPNDSDESLKGQEISEKDSNSSEGLRVVSRAAAKDEQAAGILAMDLASYLKDLREIEGTLKTRLKPTISMMKMTSYVLGPVVLGVAYGIYLSLAAIVDNGTSAVDPFAFFLVLGFFLAESSAVVTYFIWAVDSRRDRNHLLESLGWCVLVSTLVFSVTASLSS